MGRLGGMVLALILSSTPLTVLASGTEAPAAPPSADAAHNCNSNPAATGIDGQATSSSRTIVHKTALAAPVTDVSVVFNCMDFTLYPIQGISYGGLGSQAGLVPMEVTLPDLTPQTSLSSSTARRDLDRLEMFEANFVVSSGAPAETTADTTSVFMESPAAVLLALAIIGMAAVARRAPITLTIEPRI